jgi:Kef-type K+ transport system membrane component KefB
MFFIGIRPVDGQRPFRNALYLCIACALSSTVIIVKVLYEKRELDTLPGASRLACSCYRTFCDPVPGGAAEPR